MESSVTDRLAVGYPSVRPRWFPWITVPVMENRVNVPACFRQIYEEKGNSVFVGKGIDLAASLDLNQLDHGINIVSPHAGQQNYQGDDHPEGCYRGP